MNKLCYRVIFNKTRGLLMAVSELGRSHDAAPGAGSVAASALLTFNAARLRPLAFAVLVLLGAQTLTLPAAQAQIVPDPSAPRAQQAVVVSTASGLPQVNITTPSPAGVSRNTYVQFDINKPGAILNNARHDVQTKLGGWIQRNPNLATGTARVILNEVNSANPSFLRAYVEVAGDPAQVIIANPSGVTCDGCGFINAIRTTLTTGTAIMNNGNLDGFVVRRGTVTVQGEGLDSSQSDYTHIIARAVRINAGLWSRDLRIATGANRVNADHQIVEKLDGEDERPSLSIDVAQLGGMYANKIVLVGTEAGVGVRNAGTIGAAAGEVRISAAGHIENTGKIQATQTASIAATSLDNRGGKLDAGTIRIDAAALGGDGAGGFSNSGTVRSNGSIDIDSAGTLHNDGLMQAATLLKIKAATIMNGAGGTLIGTGVQLTASDAGALLNRGFIDGQETVIVTRTLRNLGRGRIFGDHVAIAATSVDNEAESVNGLTSAPVIAGRDRLDIGAENVNNREHATLFSAGDMAIGGALDGNNRATGQARSVNNNSATIEAQGALDLSARTVNNTNEHFSTELVEVSREEKREFQYSGSATRYDNSQVAIINDESDDMWLRDASGEPSVKLGNNFNRYDYTRVIQESRVIRSDPARIWTGQGLRIRADVLNNDKSQIIAGGTLTGAIGTLNNTEVPGQRIITDSGTAFHFYNIEKKGRDRQGVSSTAYYPGQTVQAISLTPTVYQQNTAVAGSGTQVAHLNNMAMSNGVRVPGVALTIGGGGAIRLPDNSLFSINTNPTLHYLVQSDPRFTNYRTWLSSDYMLRQLNADPSLMQKRVGDGFYEQKLVREQVAALTGRRFLDGYSSDEAQYGGLLDAGVTVVKKHKLKVGVELTAAQIAALTSDVVLLVEKDAVLPDGSTTRALVPQLYVRLKDGDINGHGALLAADSINLKVSDSANNSGTIAGRNVLTINATTINNNGGRLTAKDVTVVATQDVNNIGGTVDANDRLKVSAGRDLNLVSSTRDTATGQATRTSVERVAALYVANAGATLTATAGRDIHAKAAQITNSGEGGSTTLAAGDNLNLETATEKSAQSLRWDARNYRKEAMSSEVGSSIAAAGDVRVMAGNDINARGLNAASDKGSIDLAAANKVNISSAQSRQQVDEGHQTSGGSGWFSKKTVTTRDQVDQSQALGSTVSGNAVRVTAGKDVKVTGSNVVSSAGTTVSAGNDVNFAAASDKSDSSHVRNEVTGGLFSGGSFGVSIGKQSVDNKNLTVSSSAVASTVGSTEGNVAVSAGNAYKQVGSNVMAPKGDIDIIAKKISILAAADSERNTQDVVVKQSGLTLQITSPVLSAIQTVQQMKRAAQSTTDGRMQLLAAANIGFAGKNAYDAVKTGQGFAVEGKDKPQVLTNARNEDGSLKMEADGKPETRAFTGADKVGGINLSISLGASKNESHSEASANMAKGSAVAAGGNVNIAATGGSSDSNIVVQGSDIKAGVNATLKAENEVKLLAVQSTTEQHSTSKGVSVWVGVSVGTDGLLFNAGVSGSRGRGDGNDVAQVNTHVDAGNKLTLESGTDTTLKGAVASGKQVVMDVGTSGRGSLNIESLQDTSTYKSNQQSAGVNVRVGAGKMNGRLNAARSSVDGNYASVNEQSGIKAGDSGFQVNVNGNTDLKGAKIASTAKAAAERKNSLTTETLTQSDIQNLSDYKAESQSIGVGTGFDGSKMVMNGTGIGVGSSSGGESSTTRSGISQANIKITDDAAQQAKTGKAAEQTIASINTDVSSDRDTSRKLNKRWNGQALQADVQAQAQIMETFGKNAAKAIGDYASTRLQEIAGDLKKATSPEEVKALLDDQSKWQEGGLYRTALHVAAGALAGGFDGALGATTASLAMPKIDKLIHRLDLPEALRQGLAQAVAAGLGGVVGGSSGVIAGVHVEANNRQLHKKEINWIEENKKKAAKYLTEKLERKVSPEEAAAYLTLAGEGNVDDVYQRDNANNRLGSQASFERQLYNGAKQFILMNAVGSFTDDRGVTQKLFTAVGNDFYDVKVNSQLRNDKEYRDFFWKTLGENLLPDNPTTAERVEYDERQKIRFSQNLTQTGMGLIPAIMASITGRMLAVKTVEPTLTQAKTPSPEPEKIGGGKGTNTEKDKLETPSGTALRDAMISAKGQKVLEPAAGTFSANEIRLSQNSVSFNKVDRVTGQSYTYEDLVASMRSNGWQGDPIDVVRMPDGKLTSMDNTRIAAAREAGIDVRATVRSFDEALTPEVQNARGWSNYSTWGEAITARVNNQTKSFSAKNPYGSFEYPRIKGKP